MSGRTADPKIQIITAISKKDKANVYLAMKSGHIPVVLKELQGEDKTYLYKKIQETQSIFFPTIEAIEYRDGRTYILEEYIEGESLDKILENKISIKDGITYMVQLVQAIAVLHKLDPPLIHRDVKPENIMVQKNNRLVLLDFDVAREFVMGEKEQDTRMLGTRGYASPEQFGFAQTDVRSDLYSIGIVCNQITERMDIPFFLQRRLKRVLNKATMFDPAQRFQSADQMLAALCKIERLEKLLSHKKASHIVLLTAGIMIALVFMIGVGMKKGNLKAEKNDIPIVTVLNSRIVPDDYQYTSMKQVWSEHALQIMQANKELADIPQDTEGADGLLENGWESPLGNDLFCFRFFKAYPQALLFSHNEFEGKVIDSVSVERYSSGGEQLIETIRVSDFCDCKIKKGYLCVPAEAFDMLDPGIYLLNVRGRSEWSWRCYLIVHGETEKIDNFVVHAEGALQIYSCSGKNDIMFTLLNTPYPLKAVLCNGEQIDENAYSRFLDERGIILKADFLESKASEQVLEIIFVMKNNRMAYGRVLILP